MLDESLLLASARATASTGAYDTKPQRYFAGVRTDFLARLNPQNHRRVLEIGCGYGDTGVEALGRGLCQEYVGVELIERAAREAEKGLTAVLIGDIETIDLPFDDGSFDAVLISEVLEHLRDPWAALRRIVAKLRPGALLMASSPNLCHWRILLDLFRGRFDYTDVGSMDRTHLRWFTPATYAKMFEEAGVRVEAVNPMSKWGPRARLALICTCGGAKHLLMRQVCVIGTVK